VLSGSLDDGTAGLQAIKELGGMAAAQLPSDATYPDMPISAIAHVEVDCVAPADELPHRVITILSGVRCADTERAAADDAVLDEMRPRTLTCPDCGGPLQETEERARPRFRCTVERIELTRRMGERASTTDRPHTVRLLRERKEELEREANLLRVALGHESNDEPPRLPSEAAS
jgi:two-component system chemotaxis response regulator CheB